MSTVAQLLQPVESDLEQLLSDLRALIGAGHPIEEGRREKSEKIKPKKQTT